MASTVTQFITRTYQQPYRPAKLAGFPISKKTPLNATAESYNEFIWALARKFTNSAEEAEAAVQEMQNDIERCAEKGVLASTQEDRLVARIAWRRLLKFLQ